MQSGNSMQLSYWGFVETANDAMALIQPCSQGSLHFANRRPTASEWPAVAQSGHIYIYEENPSTVQRWTDDQRWSRSRMLGDFLVYAELESTQMQSPRAEDGDRPRPGQTGEENWHRRLCGSLARSVKVTPQTLIKKTFSIKGSSATWRLVSYYRLIDVIEGRLPAPLVIQTWGPRAPLQWTPIPPEASSEGDTAVEYRRMLGAYQPHCAQTIGDHLETCTMERSSCHADSGDLGSGLGGEFMSWSNIGLDEASLLTDVVSMFDDEHVSSYFNTK
jgi:hypothetical protein